MLFHGTKLMNFHSSTDFFPNLNGEQKADADLPRWIIKVDKRFV